jgi:hypothetical protein
VAGRFNRLCNTNRHEFQAFKLNAVDEKIFAVPPRIAAVKELIQLQQQARAAHFGMAYVIVHKRVRLKAKNEKGELEEETTIFAWTETYEKQNGKWTLTAVASTNERPKQQNI